MQYKSVLLAVSPHLSKDMWPTVTVGVVLLFSVVMAVPDTEGE